MMERKLGAWAGLVLGACLAVQALADTATLALPGGQEVSLPAGQVPGPRLRLFLNEVTDQRCPSEYDYYWEGLIRAVLLVNSDAYGAQHVVLCNMCEEGAREAVVAGDVIGLDHLEPDHTVIEGLGRAVVLADYTVVVTIVAAP